MLNAKRNTRGRRDRRLDDINNDSLTEWMWLEWPEMESWFGNTSTFHMASGDGWGDVFQVACDRSIFDLDTQDIDGDGEKEILGLYTDFGLAALSKALLLQSVSLHLTEITREGCRDILEVSVGISAASDVSTFWDGEEVDANDVEKSWKYFTDKKNIKSIFRFAFSKIEKVIVHNRYKVELVYQKLIRADTAAFAGSLTGLMPAFEI